MFSFNIFCCYLGQHWTEKLQWPDSEIKALRTLADSGDCILILIIFYCDTQLYYLPMLKPIYFPLSQN